MNFTYAHIEHSHGGEAQAKRKSFINIFAVLSVKKVFVVVVVKQ